MDWRNLLLLTIVLLFSASCSPGTTQEGSPTETATSTPLTQQYSIFTGSSHVHTTYSPDIEDEEATPEQVVEEARARGLDFIIITDHNTTEGALKAKKYAEGKGYKDFLVIVGEEVTCDWGHIIAAGIKEDVSPPGFQKDCGLPPEEVMKRIRRAGAFAIVAHPSWGWKDPDTGGKDLVKRLEFMQGLKPNAYEIVNGRSVNVTWAHRAWHGEVVNLEWASNYPFVSGSDAHKLKLLDQNRMYIFATELSKKAIFDAILNRRVIIQTVEGYLIGAEYLRSLLNLPQ